MLDYEQLLHQFTAEQEKNPFQFLHETIYAVLMRNIAQFEIQPGERLLEKNIASTLNVSRSPVHQALSQVVSSGFAEYTKGIGCQVTPFTRENISDLQVIRNAVEPTLAYLAAEQATKAEIHHLRSIMDQMKALDTDAAVSDTSIYFALESEFHTFLSEISRNKYIQQSYRALEFPIMRSLYMMSHLPLKKRQKHISGKTIASAYSVHLPIYLAVQLKEPDMAYNAMLNHLSYLRYDFSGQ